MVNGEIQVGVGIIADGEGEEELGAMDLTPPHDGPSILGGLVQEMKVLPQVLHGELEVFSHKLFNSIRR